jgi:hypothetical protein
MLYFINTYKRDESRKTIYDKLNEGLLTPNYIQRFNKCYYIFSIHKERIDL